MSNPMPHSSAVYQPLRRPSPAKAATLLPSGSAPPGSGTWH